MLEKIFLYFILKLPEELSHSIAIFILKHNLIFKKRIIQSNSIKTKLFNHNLSNPLGLAAGFDKNAEALPGLLNQNFSFIEVGTVTPLPQFGNKKPRVFRIFSEKSIINQLGFPNIGALKVHENLLKARKNHPLGSEPLIGVNIGCNKESSYPIKDYEKCFDTFSSVADYITINISSPNTPGLRRLQHKSKLAPLLKSISYKRDLYLKKNKRKIPLVLKISPDLSKLDLKNIANLTLKYDLQGIIATNTSTNKKLIYNEEARGKKGGISGKALFSYSNDILEQLNKLTKGKVEIIGVGGIDSAENVLKKINIGANAVQLYSALVYNGIGIIEKMLLDLIVLINNSKNKKHNFQIVKRND